MWRCSSSRPCCSSTSGAGVHDGILNVLCRVCPPFQHVLRVSSLLLICSTAYTAEPKPESPDSSHGPPRSSKRPLLSTSTPSSAAASFVLPLSPSTSAAAGVHSSASRPQSPASHAWAPQPATASSVYPPSEADAGGDAEVEAAAAQERAVDSGLRIASIGQLPPAYTRD